MLFELHFEPKKAEKSLSNNDLFNLRSDEAAVRLVPNCGRIIAKKLTFLNNIFRTTGVPEKIFDAQTSPYE